MGPIQLLPILQRKTHWFLPLDKNGPDYYLVSSGEAGPQEPSNSKRPLKMLEQQSPWFHSSLPHPHHIREGRCRACFVAPAQSSYHPLLSRWRSHSQVPNLPYQGSHNTRGGVSLLLPHMYICMCGLVCFWRECWLAKAAQY